MTRRTLIIVSGLMLLSVLGSPAWAMHHPRLGRFMQRDPLGTSILPETMTSMGCMPEDYGYLTSTSEPPLSPRQPVDAFFPRRSHDGTPGEQYSDGMALYQYCRSSPALLRDPSGLKVFGRMGVRRSNACKCQDDCDRYAKEHRMKAIGFVSFFRWLFSHKSALEACYTGCSRSTHRAVYIGVY